MASFLCLGLTACGDGKEPPSNADPAADAHLLYEQREDHFAVTGLSGDCTDKEVVIPAAHEVLPVTEIADQAFLSNKVIESVILPHSVERIGHFAFYDCSALGKAELGEGLRSIGAEAFAGCFALEAVEFPSKLAVIDSFAFNYTGLKKAILPDSVIRIGSSAFAHSPLTEIRLGGGIRSIGNYAFSHTNIEEVVFEPDLYTDIGVCVFAFNDALKTVKFGKNFLFFAYGTFTLCSSLETVTLGVAQANDGAFGGCENIKAVYFLCTEDQWDNDLIGTESDNNPENGYGNTYFANAPWYFYSEKSDPDGYHWHYTADGTKEIWEDDTTVDPLLTFEQKGDGYTVTGLDASNEKKEIVIPALYRGLPVTAIAEDAFRAHAEIGRVVLPETLTEIGDFAFFRCEALASVNFPERLRSIGLQAFCLTALSSVTIPKHTAVG